MIGHWIAEEDAEGWITCECGLHYPTRAKWETHRHIAKVRAALEEAKGGDDDGA